MAELNERLAERCRADLDRQLRGKSKTKAKLLLEESSRWLSLPKQAFDARRVTPAIANSLSLVRFDTNSYSVPTTCAQAAYCLDARVRLAAQCDRLQQEVAGLREELHIKDGRMARIEPRRRPHYPSQQRLAILMLRSARGWSLQQTARTFLVTKATIAYWNRRLRESGADELVKAPEPANKFPDFVRYTVQHLKSLCPGLGKVKIADVLCRAGLHLAANTVGWIVKEKPVPQPTGDAVAAAKEGTTSHRQSRCDGRPAQSRLARRSDHGSHFFQILGALVAQCVAPMLAVLLVDGRGRRSFLPPGHGLLYLANTAHQTCCASLSGSYDPRDGRGPQILDLRQRHSILVRQLQGLVPIPWNRFPLRRGGTARQHHSRGVFYQDAERRRHSANSGSFPATRLRESHRLVSVLVQ
jgi:transposase-like protein